MAPSRSSPAASRTSRGQCGATQRLDTGDGPDLQNDEPLTTQWVKWWTTSADPEGRSRLECSSLGVCRRSGTAWSRPPEVGAGTDLRGRPRPAAMATGRGAAARTRSRQCTRLLCQRLTDVVDADLSSTSTSIPHRHLMQSVARASSTGMCFASSSYGSRHRSRRPIRRAAAHDAAASEAPARRRAESFRPLLANLYMNRFLKHWPTANAARPIGPTSSIMPTTSSSSAAVTRTRPWRGRGR